MSDPRSWGRVAADGTVYVRTPSGERVVGQWPGGDPDEAMALYVRRYEGLQIEVELLERRVRSGTLSAEDAAKSVGTLRAAITSAHAVGDLPALEARLDALTPVIAAQREERRAARRRRLEEAGAAKEALAAEAEQIAAGSDWRDGAERMQALLEQWKALTRLDKPADDALWRRLSTARSAYTRRRRQHFTEQRERRDAARELKDKLVAEAEALSRSTDWAQTSRAYRDLMTRWKAAGPAPRGAEDRLWRRFRTAQDAFFTARDEANAAADEEFAANAAVKRQVLAEAEALLPVTDLAAARAALRDLAQRWESAGKVPREQMRSLEGRMRAVEDAVRSAEHDRWARSSPESEARAAATAAQLQASLIDLRAKRDAASEAGDERAVREAESAIAARESWLAPIRELLPDDPPP